MQCGEAIIQGFPIPIEYINPTLKFYPLELPQNVVLLRDNKNYYRNHFNYVNINFHLDKKNRMYFIHRLMAALNRSYVIIGDFLIDLKRKEYNLYVNFDTKNVSIVSYYEKRKFKYIKENIVSNDKLKFFDNNNKNNNLISNKNFNEVNSFIEYHCDRILKTTEKLKTLFNRVDYDC